MEILLMIIIGISLIFLIVFIILFLTGTSQKGLEKSFTKHMNMMARVNNNVIKNNEQILRETANKTADINKDSVKTIAHAVKEGLSDENKIYCKHCGQLIDSDSKFCKSCGKEQ